MNTLLHHLTLLTRDRDRSQLDGHLVDALFKLLNAERVRLYKLFQPLGDTLVGIAAERSPNHFDVHDDGLSWPAEILSIEHYRFLRTCLEQREPFVVLDQETSLWRHIFTVGRQEPSPFGFVSLLRKQPLSPDEIETAAGIVTIFANCQTTLDYCERDTLTGLLNRKTFDEQLFKILARLSREGDEHSGALHLPRRRKPRATTEDHWLGVIDIDFFKRINDEFGHLIGDEVLLMVANKMRLSFREEDKLFRFGGEEFVILLKPTEYAHAEAAFQRFRQTMENSAFPQVGHITVSIGFTRIALKDTASVVLDNADRALYWAKAHGRNQVHAYEKLVETGCLEPHRHQGNEVEFF